MIVAKLEPSKHVRDRWLVWLDDGSLIRVTENEVVAFALYAGMELTDQVYDQLVERAGRSEARGKALDLIAAKPMSRRELVEKLTARRPKTRDGRERPPYATPEQADEAADWLEDIGALDDAAYAAALVRHYGGKGFGPARVKEELRRRGVDRSLWDEALEEMPEAAEVLDELIRKKRKGDLSDPKEKKRISDGLMRRGFAWSDIRAAMGRYTNMMEDGYD